MALEGPYINQAESIAISQNTVQAARASIIIENNTYTDAKLNIISTGIGSATPTDIPQNNIKIYSVYQAGTYINFSNLVVSNSDLTSGLVQLTQTGTGSIWSKVIIPINLSNYIKKDDIGFYPEYYPEEDIISDEEGYYIYRANKQYFNYIGQVKQSDITILNEKINQYASTIYPDLYVNNDIVCDEDGYVATWTKEDGSFDFIGKTAGEDVIVSNSNNYNVRIPTDYVHIISYGQSLSVAGSTSDGFNLYNTKTFAGGILTNYDPDIVGAANTYFGNGLVDLSTSGTETQLRGLVHLAKEQIAKLSGKKVEDLGFNFIVNAPGSGGVAWSLLSDVNGIYYRRMIESVRRAKDFAIAEGKSYSCYGYLYIQGENTSDKSVSSAVWYSRLETLYQQMNTDIKAISGQDYALQCINYQIASYPNNEPATVNPPLGTLKWCLEKDYAHFGCSMYQMDYSDSLHGTSFTYRRMGAVMGVVLSKLMVRDYYREKVMELPLISNTTPIYPISKKITQNSTGTLWLLEITFQVPDKQHLVIDETVNTEYVTPPVNYGFSIKNGVTEIIQSVYVGDDRISFKCNANPTGLALEYAVGGRASGGNIRDNQGEVITFTHSGTKNRIDNWMPIFIYII